MKTKELEIPQTDLIQKALPQLDFSDCFATTNHEDDMESIGRKVFTTFPKWVLFLLRIRKFLVQFLGLNTTMPPGYHKRYEVGGYFSFFKIYEIRESELLLGADDKHLNFRVSILKTQDKQWNIKVSTLVQFNNSLGKYYMAVVAPFHRWVIRSMIKQAYVK